MIPRGSSNPEIASGAVEVPPGRLGKALVARVDLMDPEIGGREEVHALQGPGVVVVSLGLRDDPLRRMKAGEAAAALVQDMRASNRIRVDRAFCLQGEPPP